MPRPRELGERRMQPPEMQGRRNLFQRINWFRLGRRGATVKNRLTPSELEARLKFIIGCVLGGVLLITTVGILYALVFVAQPTGVQAENDKMFFNVLSSVATFITGTLAGLMISNVKTPTDSGEQDE